jgi:hypothetical protein
MRNTKLHVSWVGYALPVAPLEVICGWVDDFGDKGPSHGAETLCMSLVF